jgi:chlorobactene glucosyltransferase
MGDGAELIACRMYSNWMTVRDGYAKNILAGHGNRISFLLLSTLFHWLVFIAPWIWLAFGWIDLLWPLQQVVAWPIWPLALIVLGVGVRALSAAATRQRARDALWMPISALLMTIVAGQAIWWRWRYGGTLWKGRTISASHKQQDLNPLELPHNQK